MIKMDKTVILDRDGVINADSPCYIKSPAEWQAITGSLYAISRLKRAGYRVVIATNQSGLARGLFDTAVLNQIHAEMLRQLALQQASVDGIFYCPHGPEADCRCRKPKPGLFFDIATHFGISLHDVVAVGDSLRDLQAAAAAGAKPVLVKTGNGLKTLEKLPESALADTPVYENLAAVADKLLQVEFTFSMPI
jgi:D-glycero-D-manno-heptose 1,7-bisphosphate phosphatase